MRRALRDETGQAIVLIAMTMTVLLGFVGLAVDAGQLFNQRRTAQEAADSAAFAGAVVLFQNGTSLQATTAATTDAALNGYATDVPVAGTTVDVNHPPEDGDFIDDMLCVEVTITTTVTTALMPDVADLTTVKARGVACSVSNNLGYAVMSLAQDCTDGAIALKSNGIIAVNGGGIQINSCSAEAGDNSGTVTMEAGYYTDVVGGVAPPASDWPNLRTGQTVKPNPFAGLAEPSTTGLPAQTPACSPTVNQPGVYTSAFGTQCNYVLAPGNYILKGGGINLQGNSSLCTGATCNPATATDGVFIFLTHSNYPDAPGTCGSIALNGNNVTTLSPPTSGTYAGMLIWQDDACEGSISIGGNGAINATGTIYAPNAAVVGNGNNASVTVTQIVSETLDTQNANFTFNYDPDDAYVGSIPALVE